MRESNKSKSPKIDSFYKSLRNYMTTKDEEEDKSIQEIRLMGKQLLGKQKKNQTSYEAGLTLSKQSLDHVRSSSIQAQEWKKMNLYDKYKHQNKIKTQRKIVQKTQQIANEISKSKQKYWKNPKYEITKSKFLEKQSTNTLNYEKRVDKKIAQLKKIQLQAKKCKERQREKHMKFKNVSKVENKVDRNFKNVLKRGDELQKKKQRLRKTLKNEELEKQMEGVTFQPKLIARQSTSIEKNFEKRQVIKEYERKSNEKNLIKETVLRNTFTPKINKNNHVKSVTRRIWDDSPESFSKESSIMKHSREMAVLSQKQYLEQLPTANQSTRVTIRNQSEIQFLMNQ